MQYAVCRTQHNWEIHNTETAKSKKVHLLDLLEKMDDHTNDKAEETAEYTSPFTDIFEYQNSQIIKVPKRIQQSQEVDTCKC